MAVEPRRGCGYRRIGGLYVVGGGLSAPCDRMPYPLERCRHCGGGIKFTRGPQWLQPDFFPEHAASECACRHNCPVCNRRAEGFESFGPHLLLWIGRGHYSPDAYLKESRELGVSRRLSAMPKGLVLGETWVLLAHLDAVPPADDTFCAQCGVTRPHHHDGPFTAGNRLVEPCKEGFQPKKPTPGIFCAFVPRAVELILKQSDATTERIEKEAKRGVTVVAVPDDDKDHQGSVWDSKDDEDSQPELPGVTP